MHGRGSKWLLHNFIIHFVHTVILKSGYENLAMLLMKIQVFWDVVTACPLVMTIRYGVSFQN
jgi:hypothetical protein